jgi:23S rRNA pseudouridine2457 synthase
MQRYFIIYKPYMVLSQFSAQEGKQTLADFFNVPKDVYPVGRLDADSEGLLILTNDKALKAISNLQKGVTINVDGIMYATKPCKASLLSPEPIVPPRTPPIRYRKDIPAPWIELILTEGKNRQVRKMTAAIGFPTLRLIRSRIKNIMLGDMQPGDMIELSKAAIYKKLLLPLTT